MTKEERKADARAAYEALMKFYPFTLDDLDGEQWRPISGYEGLYHISNFERVKSFWKSKIKILKPALDGMGYLYLGLKQGKQNRNFRIYRLVAKAFISNPSNKPEVNHIDGHPLNNHVSNLEWATRTENMRHAARIGLLKFGEERYGALLKNSDVVYIRNNPDNLTMTELARKLGVTLAKISEIQLGKKYKNVGGTVREPVESQFKFVAELRAQIRSEYIKGDLQFGMHALAKKYGCNATMIWRIVHEKD